MPGTLTRYCKIRQWCMVQALCCCAFHFSSKVTVWQPFIATTQVKYDNQFMNNKGEILLNIKFNSE